MAGPDDETAALRSRCKMTVDRIAVHGSDTTRRSPGVERADYGATVPVRRFRDTLVRLKSDRPALALDDAVLGRLRPERTMPGARHRVLRRAIVDGVSAEHRIEGGAVRGAQARVVDFDVTGKPDTREARVDTVSEAGVPEAAGQASMRRASVGATATLRNPHGARSSP